MARTNPVTRLPAARTFVKCSLPSSARSRMAATICAAFAAQFALAAPPAATALPTGGQVVAGQATIQQAGAAMTIRQATDQAILNWQTFNIGASASVNFIQPGVSSVALNRVLGSDPSAIYGSLTANGQVFLVNPSGVLFGPGARVDVGGLVASTLAIRDADFLARNYRFSRDGATGTVVNAGYLSAQYVALLAPEVRNEGVIAARMGTVALAAGDVVTLGISGQRLVDVQVDKASIDTLVENRHLIRADEGMVILSAQSAHTLLGRVVNSGAVEANGISTDGGSIRLLASSTVDHSGSIAADGAANASGGTAILLADLANPASRTTVSGSITARGGSESGDGGFVETSAHRLSIADSTRVDTLAPNGRGGLWLLDPIDLTIAPNGDISGTTISTALNGGTDVTLTTNAAAALCDGAACPGTPSAGANGDIHVNQEVSWTTAKTLKLSAWHDVNINSPITSTDAAGKLALEYEQGGGGGGTYRVNAPVTLASGNNFSTKDGVGGTDVYYVIATPGDLASPPNGLGNRYVLGADIDVVGTNPWMPIGAFTGTMDGLRHVVKNVTIAAANGANIGLFSEIGNGGVVQNLGVENVDVAGLSNVGGLAGKNAGTLRNTWAIGNVKGFDTGGNANPVTAIGGLVGRNEGTIEQSYASVTVNAAAAGNEGIQGGGGAADQGGIGGLVGINFGGTITRSYAIGSVSGVQDVGGLIGFVGPGGAIQTVYSRGAVSATGGAAGGLIGADMGFGSANVIGGLWDTDTSLQAASAAGGGAPPTGKTTLEMKQATTFINEGSATWEFANGWAIYETETYPTLRPLLTPLFAYADNKTRVYNAQAGFAGLTATLSIAAPDGAKVGGAATVSDAAITKDANLNPIMPSGLTQSIAQKQDQHGYLISYIPGVAAITPKALTVNAAGVANTKIYDGSTAAAGAALQAAEAAGGNTAGKPYTGDDVSLTGNGTFDFKDAGVATTITFGGLGLGGAEAGNYTLTPAADINGATITKLALAITNPVVANKAFDNATTATVTDPGVLSGFAGIETVTRAVNTATFDTAAIGAGKNVTVNYTLGNGTNGGLAANYSLADKVVMANITAAAPAPEPAPAPVVDTPVATTSIAVETVVTKTEQFKDQVRKDLCAAISLGSEVCGQVRLTAPTTATGSTSRVPVISIAAAPAGPVAANSLTADYTQNSLGAYPVRVPSADSSGRSVLTARPEVVGTVSGGQGFNFTLPDDTFTHTNPNAVVQLSATQTNGEPLPGWMSFDPRTGKITATPPVGVPGQMSIRVQARDSNGKEATTTLKLNLGQGSKAGALGSS